MTGIIVAVLARLQDAYDRHHPQPPAWQQLDRAEMAVDQVNSQARYSHANLGAQKAGREP